MKIYHTSSLEETRKLGKLFAREILRRRFGKAASVVALHGELGSGKTTFIQGFLRGFGVRKRAASPTFIIFRRFPLPTPATVSAGRRGSGFRNLYHVDAYRLRTPKELRVLEFEKTLKNPRNIVVIEWAEKIKKILPKETVWLQFKHGKKENERVILA